MFAKSPCILNLPYDMWPKSCHAKFLSGRIFLREFAQFFPIEFRQFFTKKHTIRGDYQISSYFCLHFTHTYVLSIDTLIFFCVVVVQCTIYYTQYIEKKKKMVVNGEKLRHSFQLHFSSLISSYFCQIISGKGQMNKQEWKFTYLKE